MERQGYLQKQTKLIAHKFIYALIEVRLKNRVVTLDMLQCRLKISFDVKACHYEHVDVAAPILNDYVFQQLFYIPMELRKALVLFR